MFGRSILVVSLMMTFLFWGISTSAISASDTDQQDIVEGSPPVKDCQISDAARDAIDQATSVWMQVDRAPEALDLILAAEKAGNPPECDSVRAKILADKAIELTKQPDKGLIISDPLTSSRSWPAKSSKSWSTKSLSPVFGFNWADISFEDDVFGGSGRIFGFTLGASFNSHYEIGYEYNSNAAFDFMFDDLFYSEPSLDEGRDLGTFEDFHITSQMLYLRGNWLISEKIAGYALVGYSEVEFEVEKATFDCGPFPIFPLVVPFCLNEDGIGSTKTYQNKESGIAWGVGLQWKPKSHNYVSLKYIDQSNGDIDFSGTYLSWGYQDWD